MLVVLGTLNVVQGLIALFDDGYFVIRRESDLLLVDFTAWGIVLLLWGALLILAGLGLISGRGWARWFAVFAASVNIIAQIGFLPAYPILAAIMVGLDVVIIFALTARWGEARGFLS
jgi:uncharacterized membrane protein (DUF2068 family)